MFVNFIKNIVGTKNERELKKIQPIVEEAKTYEETLKTLSDYELSQYTPRFKERIENGEELDSIMPEAFALVREAARRTIGMRHFDVQLIGGVILHHGKIAEMATGEGKTLVATLPVYLNALGGLGVHVVTVNDYLAKRDSEWMGPVYKFLGLTVGVILNPLDDYERKKAYACDITYGTNNEFGFDYLRDNMKYSLDECVQREFNYAIVDEVDSILIDEARTPLIISGPAEESTDKYYKINKLVHQLKKEKDFIVDEKARTAYLTEEGVAKIENIIKVDNLYDPKYVDLLHHINQALKAHHLFKRDVDYIVKDGKVIIVDEFTGRLMDGRRFSDGLHQALEAAENVKIERENQTLATVTFQNYFRMYKKLAGMTGTADTEAVEFKKIYNLDVVVTPTNKPLIRANYSDVIYRTEKEKLRAVINEIEELYKKGRPVLVGTLSIDKSEKVSDMLKRRGVQHHILNAKNHEREAEIVAQAGRSKAVTISTNMAGRGTDILLGGNPEFLALSMCKGQKGSAEFDKALEEAKRICAKDKEEVISLGGLHILGTERHESRRIDNQLRGRAGRQGDPGSSRFYVCLEDEIMRLFGSDKVSPMLAKLGMKEDMPIEHPFITKAIENAQTRVEGHNFEIRKYLLEYDNVMNKQRETIYGMRRQLMSNENVSDQIYDMIEEICEGFVDEYAPEKVYPEEWELNSLKNRVFETFFFHINFDSIDFKTITKQGLLEMVKDSAFQTYHKKEADFGEQEFRALERFISLNSLDTHWKEHLLALDHLKEGIGLRGYGQKDPLREYQKESFELFLDMLEQSKLDTVRKLYAVQPAREELTRDEPVMFFNKTDEALSMQKDKKIGRNDPCPCGSGKKYKKCCGR
ncbi:MAG TPA: preprotein translocase subunit SecA [Syntrophorhabdaceae bacterium]|nr:Protein translocase subunit SecA [Syntrophorhabdaceae bacterium]MDI9561968.1 preprotein translocase subunit SecA [Pseudomonadota bacterium]HNZ58829.1 preprotein translocase subunit SecA [Syntrophorhabdaceae bacterium]HOB69638.1 preprotein translocase subunit SecA [Syntrophorhabdaceae bacterium]HQG50941.1 preprotein translocase subunit SecA [Syntrophorhabdaceae bacterium]